METFNFRSAQSYISNRIVKLSLLVVKLQKLQDYEFLNDVYDELKVLAEMRIYLEEKERETIHGQGRIQNIR